MHKNELAQLSANYWCVEALMCVSKAHGFNKHLVAQLEGLLVYCRALKHGGHHSTAAQNWKGGERNSNFFFCHFWLLHAIWKLPFKKKEWTENIALSTSTLSLQVRPWDGCVIIVQLDKVEKGNGNGGWCSVDALVKSWRSKLGSRTLLKCQFSKTELPWRVQCH